MRRLSQGVEVHNTMSRARGVLLGGILVAVLVVFVAVACSREDASQPLAEVKDIDVGPPGQHRTGNLDYDQSPPAGGPHNPTLQNCGFYDEPVRDEHAVHSLEHGAVWITYQPDLAQKEIGKIQDLAQNNSLVLASPYPDQDSPVVATAWGKQLTLEGTEDPDLERFIRKFSEGPQTPDIGRGAGCSGGVGQPQ
jgi:hypothetical protein